jgi:curved DNA-binding protein CbpA
MQSTSVSEVDLSVKDALEVLGLSSSTKYLDQKTLQTAWKSKSKTYHPDRNSSEEAAIKYDIVNKAYNLLKKKKVISRRSESDGDIAVTEVEGIKSIEDFNKMFKSKAKRKEHGMLLEEYLDESEVYERIKNHKIEEVEVPNFIDDLGEEFTSISDLEKFNRVFDYNAEKYGTLNNNWLEPVEHGYSLGNDSTYNGMSINITDNTENADVMYNTADKYKKDVYEKDLDNIKYENKELNIEPHIRLSTPREENIEHLIVGIETPEWGDKPFNESV